MLLDIRKIKTEEELIATLKAGEMDNDGIKFPSHMIMKDDRIVGSWSLNKVPLAMLWHDSNSVGVRDSMLLNKTMDAVMNDRGHDNYLMACDSTSPYSSYMDRAGYKLIWNTNIYYKEIG